MGPEAEDAVTAAEWLAAHRAEQADADQHRPIAAEHDLADAVEQRDADVAAGTTDELASAADTALLDVRDAVAEPIADESGRIPDADESQAAVRRAQAALAEIRQRQALDKRHAAEECRARQLDSWDGQA